ncbi:MAG: RAMP superfamily CRISPR-associated protein, partial [archaeon GB-1867-035]|nr:RAMP superfamily CRISPR-associated protein [Candidatus Culexmicrobium profundum]
MRLGLIIKTKSLLSIGSGRAGFLADIVLYRALFSNKNHYLENYIIPGSTIKGVLRTSASKIAWMLNLSSCGQVDPLKISRTHSLMKVSCDVCKIFGEPGGTFSPLEVTEFYPIRHPSNAVKIFNNKVLKIDLGDSIWINDFIKSLTRIRLSDDTQNVAEGALFKSEYYPPLTFFYGEVKLNKPLNWSYDYHLNACRLILLSIANMN